MGKTFYCIPYTVYLECLHAVKLQYVEVLLVSTLQFLHCRSLFFFGNAKQFFKEIHFIESLL